MKDNTIEATISPTDDVHSSATLVLASEPAGAGDELATSVASFLTEYNNLDSEINDLTSELLEQDRKLVKRSDDELLPRVNRMWMLLSTIQRKLKKLRGSDEPEAEIDDDATEDDTDESSDCGGLHEREELKTGAELLNEHINQMENVLVGKSIMNEGMRIKRAIGLLKDLQCAVEEGFLVAAPPVAEREKVAAAPDKLDPSVSMLNA
jgi:hypothetical protein